jgi:hypothetical protein
MCVHNDNTYGFALYFAFMNVATVLHGRHFV